jgi:hypothetical protein
LPAPSAGPAPGSAGGFSTSPTHVDFINKIELVSWHHARAQVPCFFSDSGFLGSGVVGVG